ncbi:MAG TPA: baseplate J/gp47 family protein [Nocardioidaceae bacterium]|nr:baseplate J/gp47 family protein [Nocardioidaceae bacterium]
MPSYIGPDDDPTDPDELAEAAFDSLTEYIPGYVPDDNSLENWLILALSRIAATNADVAKQMPLAAFRWYGQTVIGLQPNDAVAATTTITVTAVDDAGYTIPAGTNVGYQITGDVLVPFETTADVIIPPGSIATPDGAVPIQALTAGASGNGYTPDQLVLIDALAWVDSIAATGATTGGLDGETDDQYVQRLINDLQLSTPTPILAAEFGAMARNVTGVFRAVGVDNYNPADGTTDNERMVAVAVVDDQGQPLSAGVKANVETYLESLREIGFIVNVFDPNYTVVDVAFTFTPTATADPNAVLAAAIDTVTAFLNPATWGVTEGDLTGTSWEETNTVYRSALMGALMAVDGLRWVNSLTVNGSAADEVALTGPAALPTVGSITGALAA